MANTLKILGQTATTSSLTTLYTVGSSVQSTISTLVACNTGATPTTFSISVALSGASDSIQQYLYYNVPINGNDTFAATIGLTLGGTDVVRVKSGNGACSFSAFGIEKT
jgi:hypothetical protein